MTLIQFETAKLAKEKGFRGECHSYYFEDGKFKEHKIEDTYGYYGDEYTVKLSEFYNNWNDKFLTKKNGDRCFGCDKNREYFETFSAPTQSELQKWLREKHNIYVIITEEFYANGINHNVQILTYDSSNVENNYINNNKSTKMHGDNGEFKTYEEALEFGLQKALKLIENDNN